MAAAGETEVLAADADPLEVLGSGEHPLHELAVRVLDPLPLHQGLSGLGCAIGKLVPNRLELAEIEHPRRRGGCLDPVRDLGMAESLADEAGELGLKPADLPAQLQSRLALVDRDIEPIESSLFQQSRHLQ